MMKKIYQGITAFSQPALLTLLRRRLKQGKEDPERWREKTAQTSVPRPPGCIYWLHAASVGEAQSALILIQQLLIENPDITILVTSGTKSSANMLADRLPAKTIHQYAPLDQPQWITNFLDHWQPQVVLWMESELWPNLLLEIQNRGIPAALINARLSSRSFRLWQLIRPLAREVLATFSLILCQSDQDQQNFMALGATNIHTTGNIKYSATPLPYDESSLRQLKQVTDHRRIWVYASSHAGEETLACDVHLELKRNIPDLLTIIVPRHPERKQKIQEAIKDYPLQLVCRSTDKQPPSPDTDIYLADTFGELGLFYRLCPIAFIGRSLSQDGGGGHNPIEAAQLGCACLHGPHVQNLAQIYNQMDTFGAAYEIKNKTELLNMLERLLNDQQLLDHARNQAMEFVAQQMQIVEAVLEHLRPILPRNKTAL